MTRAHLRETALCALAVVVAAWPIGTLLRDSSWTGPTLLVVALVALLGAGLRSLRVPAWGVVLAQLVGVCLAVCLLHDLGSGPAGLPWTDVGDRLVDRLEEAGRTIRSYAAPAPPTRGLVTLISLLTGLVAILVDHLVVARRAATVAGFPLLVVYLVAVVNTGVALPAMYFLALALLWLLLLVEQHGSQLRRWATLAAAPSRGSGADDPATVVSRFSRRSRLVAVAVVLAAAGIQALLPDIQTRFLTEGLGRQEQAGRGSLSFTSDVDITRSLGSRDPRPVLTLRTSDGSEPPPLAVTIAKQYVDGHWRMIPTPPPSGQGQPAPGRALGLPDGIAPGLPHRAVTARVSDNTVMRPPQLAAPVPALAVGTDVPWRRDATTGLVSVGRAAEDYTVSYAVPTLTPEQLSRAAGGSAAQQPYATSAFNDGDYLDVDPASRELVDSTTREVLSSPDVQRYGAADSAYAKAMAIQQYLRSPTFVYSLTLAPLTEEERQRGVEPDAVSHFLRTRRGYCTQFSSAMVMMARSQGIPARVVFGFLPGSLQPDGTRIVRAADAHAWPELFIDGAGWTRFEPTPGGRSGLPPAWATPPTAPTATASTSAPTTTSSARPRPAETDTSTAAPTQPGLLDRLRGWFTPARIITLGLLLLAAVALAVTPLRAARVRRRRLARAGSPAAAVESHWTTLAEQLRDLGVGPPTGMTPRTLTSHYDRYALLPDDGKRALARVLAAVERARYAPPGASASPRQVQADAQVVRRSFARTRSWPQRLRAALLPSAGRGSTS
ncbi:MULTISPECIES: transglutaminaseTgpA domain-containing protein [Arsenicicoccus]|uniref:transglutaminase family protein n=1 Tax=Arsenicicoccus TaxID=267408 RepID=UPI00257DB05B|nr:MULTISPECIES: transglutaminase domain-containing protein [Arsenicicoccus]